MNAEQTEVGQHVCMETTVRFRQTQPLGESSRTDAEVDERVKDSLQLTSPSKKVTTLGSEGSRFLMVRVPALGTWKS